jgi:hypothetical protein
MRLSRNLLLGVTAAAALSAVSCGSGGGIEPIKETGATLTGKVTYGNEPVPMALVIVAQTGGGSATAFADDDGNFKVENVPVGDVLIAVNTDATKGQMTGRAMAGTDPKAKGKKTVTPKLVEVPKKYHNPDTSGLTTKTQQGANQYDITIPR